jgi:putative endonuclease
LGPDLKSFVIPSTHGAERRRHEGSRTRPDKGPHVHPTSFVYILASVSRCLYTGVTTDLVGRLWKHRTLQDPRSFCSRYRVHRLVYYECFGDVRLAIEREKQLKSWTRAKRVSLINRANPGWADLAARWPDIEQLP